MCNKNRGVVAILLAACLTAAWMVGSTPTYAAITWGRDAIAPSPLPPEPATARFERITTADGLPDDAVYAMLQDQQGFMWFGTNNGLARYDGYRFTEFSSIPGDPTTLSHDTVLDLYQDQNGDLWACTLYGLDRLNRDTATFAHYLTGRLILSLGEDREGTFWVGTTFGLFKLDPDNPEPTAGIRSIESSALDPRRLSGNVVWTIYPDSTGQMWIGTGGGEQGMRAGLDLFDPASETFAHYRHDPDDPTSLGGDSVFAVALDHEGGLWVGTDTGISRLDRETGVFDNYKHDPGDSGSLDGSPVQAILEDSAGRLWIGTEDGLSLFDREAGRFYHYRHDPDDPRSLSNNTITALYEDRSGVIWIGTLAGINKYDETASRFNLHQDRPGSANGLSDSHVHALFEDRSGALWVGTNSGGLNRLDRNTGTNTIYRHDPDDPGSLSSDGLLAVYEDRAGTLWVTTDARWLERFDPQSETFVDVYYVSTGIPTVLAGDSAGNLWLGTNHGLLRFAPGGASPIHYRATIKGDLIHNSITGIFETHSGRIAVLTAGGGINVWDPVEDRFEYVLHQPGNPNSLSHNTVWAVYEDVDNGVAWIGTWQGLDRIDLNTNAFTHYTEADGLPDKGVISIFGDDEGYLWLGTEWGLSRFDPRTESFRTFDARDGLQSGRFYHAASFQNERGEILIGGSHGFNIFDPSQIPDNPHPPTLIITAVSLFNKVVRRDLPPDAQIELSHEENFLSFEFAALDYTAPEKNLYAYRLEGVDTDWVYAGTRRRADYPDLRPGDYLFRVKGANNDGVWNEKGATVRIRITPPFWLTWWFWGIVTLALAGGAVGAYRWRVRSLEARSRNLQAQVAQRTADLERAHAERIEVERALRESEAAKAVAQERNRLARDLHDSVTQSLYSLTLLSEAGQRFAEAGDLERVRGYQSRIGEIGQQTLNEMRLLVYELRPLALENQGLVSALRQRLEAVEQRVGIETRLVLEDEAGTAQLPGAVEEEIFHIAQEALNNALKHAAAHSVTVRLRVDGQGKSQTVDLEVIDDGQGFDVGRSRDLGGMGLANMRERAEALGGTLTIDSAPGEGTRIQVAAAVQTLHWEAERP